MRKLLFILFLTNATQSAVASTKIVGEWETFSDSECLDTYIFHPDNTMLLKSDNYRAQGTYSFSKDDESDYYILEYRINERSGLHVCNPTDSEPSGKPLKIYAKFFEDHNVIHLFLIRSALIPIPMGLRRVGSDLDERESAVPRHSSLLGEWCNYGTPVFTLTPTSAVIAFGVGGSFNSIPHTSSRQFLMDDGTYIHDIHQSISCNSEMTQCNAIVKNVRHGEVTMNIESEFALADDFAEVTILNDGKIFVDGLLTRCLQESH